MPIQSLEIPGDRYRHQTGPSHSPGCQIPAHALHLTDPLARAVDITLVALDAAKHVEDCFREDVGAFLRIHGHDVMWVPSGACLTIVLHQPEQRVNAARVLDAVCSYERTGALQAALDFQSQVNSCCASEGHSPRRAAMISDPDNSGRIATSLIAAVNEHGQSTMCTTQMRIYCNQAQHPHSCVIN
jgi:hypothetical protein